MNSTKHFDVGIVGLGYVGLTLATAMAEVGLRVAGIEKREELVALTNQGKPHFSETGLDSALKRVVEQKFLTAFDEFSDNFTCDAYVITVGTPLDEHGKVRLDMIEAASRQVSDHMNGGELVILRSTVQIGTAREVVAPLLDESGKPFVLAMCPERTLEGKAMQELRELPQIVGADSQPVRDRASSLFRNLTNSVLQLDSLEAAEIVKLVDNTYRDVHFAFANEVARVCEAYNVNASEVISSGKLGYPRTNVPIPGLVGGPCLSKDPHILAQSAARRHLNLELTRASRLVNERQPAETVSLIRQLASAKGIPANMKIAVLGMAFKGIPSTDDLRGSMSIHVLTEVVTAFSNAEIVLFDPVIEPSSLRLEFPDFQVADTFSEALSGAQLVIITNNHPRFSESTLAQYYEHMATDGIVYDYWNHFSRLPSSQQKGRYFAVGNVAGISQ